MLKITGKIETAQVRKITEAMGLYAKATRKDSEAILNRFMKNVTIYASSKTPKANPTRIEGQLRRVLGHRIATAKGKRLKKPKPITVPTSLARAIVLKRLRDAGKPLPSSAEITRLSEALVKSRLRGVGFSKAGFIPALRAFGAPISKAGAKQFGPDRGSGQKATPASLRAQLINSAPEIEAIAGPALAAAVREATVDMMTYAKRKLAERAAKTNARMK